MSEIHASPRPTALPFTGLDRKLNQSIKLAMILSAGQGQPRALTVEFFLCSLYLRHRRTALKFFQSESGFTKILMEQCPECGQTGFRMPKLRESDKPLFVSAGRDLVLLLGCATKLSRAALRKKTGIADIISALSLNDDLIKKLEEKGLVLRGRP